MSSAMSSMQDVKLSPVIPVRFKSSSQTSRRYRWASWRVSQLLFIIHKWGTGTGLYPGLHLPIHKPHCVLSTSRLLHTDKNCNYWPLRLSNPTITPSLPSKPPPTSFLLSTNPRQVRKTNRSTQDSERLRPHSYKRLVKLSL